MTILSQSGCAVSKISARQVAEIKNIIGFWCKTWVFCSSDIKKLYEAVKHKFNVVSIDDIEADQYSEVLEFLTLIQSQMTSITKIMSDFKDYSFSECILGGAPLTVSTIRKYRSQLDELPPLINWAQMVQDLDTGKQAAKQAAKAALEAAHV